MSTFGRNNRRISHEYYAANRPVRMTKLPDGIQSIKMELKQ